MHQSLLSQIRVRIKKKYFLLFLKFLDFLAYNAAKFLFVSILYQYLIILETKCLEGNKEKF